MCIYLNSVQQMVSGELAGECLQTGFGRHGLPPQTPPLDTVYPFREHLNSVQRMVSGGYCEGLFPDTVCWTRLRNTWLAHSDLFLRRVREGISFPNILEASILKLPLSKLCAVRFALQNRALFERRKRAKRC